MFWLGLTAVLVAITGLVCCAGYALGKAHGRQEALSEVIGGFYRRRTPEPCRLQLVHGVFDQDGPGAA